MLLIAILIVGNILQDITLRLIKLSGTALAALFVVIGSRRSDAPYGSVGLPTAIKTIGQNY